MINCAEQKNHAKIEKKKKWEEKKNQISIHILSNIE